MMLFRETGYLMKIRIEPYKTWSGGAKALGLRAGILRATKKQVEKHGEFDIIINWGRTEKRFLGAKYLNEPECVLRATNKQAALEILVKSGVPTLQATTLKDRAQEW